MYTINSELSHSGIKGQRWGIRRFQNEDGTLTEEGRLRYYDKQQRREERVNVKEDAKILSRGSRIYRHAMYSQLAAAEGRHYANKVWNKAQVRRLGTNAIKAAVITGMVIMAGKGIGEFGKWQEERARKTLQKTIQTVAPVIAKYKSTH